jgi:hypothetical protein
MTFMDEAEIHCSADRAAAAVLSGLTAGTGLALAQSHDHHSTAVPTMVGQDAFGTVQEIVRILEADPETDWSKVNLEALRQHLIDMNEVTLMADASAEPVEGGLRLTVAGSGRTVAALQRLVPATGAPRPRPCRTAWFSPSPPPMQKRSRISAAWVSSASWRAARIISRTISPWRAAR